MSDNFKDIWSLKKPGAKDSARHKERIKQAIKDNLKGLISEESIITSKNGKKIKLPMQYLDQWRFKFGKNDKTKKVGQGPGEPGDVIASDDNGDIGQAGQDIGEDIYEEEVNLEEVIELMLEDLDLPFLEDKRNAIEVETEEIVFQDIAERGLVSNIDKRRTVIENMKRNAMRGKLRIGKFEQSDLRYRVWEKVIEKHSNAAVFLLMDRSGSMTDENKYIVKSFFWWMIRFLERKYNNVEIIFIAHDTVAKEVEEKGFFEISQSGGTACSSAFKLAKDIIDDRYDPNTWNNYVFEFSDGDNWGEDNKKCVELVKELLTVCQAVGYGEVRYNEWFYNWPGAGKNTAAEKSKLQYAFFSDKELKENNRFISTTIKSREDIYECLKVFLQGVADGND